MPSLQTRNRLYIVGGPGGSSIGPEVHEHVGKTLGLQWKCEFLQLNTVEEAMEYLRRPDFAGALITMPHKRTIIPLIHYYDDLVRTLGACNCVYLSPNGEFFGTNTDWVGIYDSILARSPDHVPGRIGMVYGAGGASRAAVYTLWVKLKCAKVYVVNRDENEVAELFDDLHRQPDLWWPNVTHVRSVTESENLAPPDYIVSTVPDFEPVTKEECEARNILEEFMLRNPSNGLLLDMCYHPPMTRIVKIGIRYNWEIIQGFTVVASQFSCQWKLWTGKVIDMSDVYTMTERLVREQQLVEAAEHPLAIENQ